MQTSITKPKIFKFLGYPDHIKEPKKLLKDHEAKIPVLLVKSEDKLMVMKVYPTLIQNLNFYYTNETRFKSLSHPNIMPIQQDGEFIPSEDPEMGYQYTLSPYCKNQTFHELFAVKRLKLDEVTLRTYFHQLVSGLEYLHSQGVSHLDLKPDNILIDDNFQLKIFDFDLSHKNTDPEIIVRGSYHYRAPELIKKGNCKDPFKADIYSLGILLFVFHNGRIQPFFEDRHPKLRKAFDEDPSSFWGEFKKTFQLMAYIKWSESFKSLFVDLVQTDPEKRLTIEQIKETEWYKGEVLTPDDLKIQMQKAFKYY